ncbi:unnamed protein product, partial [Nesidiocoris tenuis]
MTSFGCDIVRSGRNSANLPYSTEKVVESRITCDYELRQPSTMNKSPRKSSHLRQPLRKDANAHDVNIIPTARHPKI